MRRLLAAAFLTAIAGAPIGAAAAAEPASATSPATPLGAVSDSRRPAEDRARDPDRKPMEMMAFAKIRPGETVVDFVPGGGYFTRLFAVAVGPSGKVFAMVPSEVAGKYDMEKKARAAAAPYPNVEVAVHPIGATDAPEGVADLVWTAQNYHDLHTDLFGAPVDVAAFDRTVFRALKPGGYFVIVDHVAPAGAADAPDKLHRIDPAQVRREVEAAGFKFDGQSPVLHNGNDPHTAAVFDPSIRGHTDQFAYRFRKPG